MEKSIKLSDKEREEIYFSLSMRCGFIETGTINRAVDLERVGRKDKIKVLSSEQMKLIVTLEDLLQRILIY